MKRSFIVFNIITFLFFILLLITSFIAFNGDDILIEKNSKDFTAFFFKSFSLIGLLIQFYIVNKKLSELD